MKLFVYGTLKRNKRAHHLMDGAVFLCEYTVNGSLYGRKGIPYPMAKFMTGGTIHGELYEITEDMLPAMDAYEGHPHLYLRKMIMDDVMDSYFVYEYQGDVSNLDVIKSGVF